MILVNMYLMQSKKIKHEPVSRTDLIGNLCRFEAVRKVYDNIYRLVMGS